MMDSSTLDSQLLAEVGIINRTLAAFGVDAGTRPAWTTVAGGSFVVFGLRMGATQRISGIGQLLPELSERLSAARRRATPVRLREMPLGLEVAHPAPAPLDWRLSTLRCGAGRMVAGRNYSMSPAQDCIIDLAQRPHVLVVGTTGSGKSTVLRMLLSSLAFNADPATVRLVLVDRKNEDLVPFARLPHVERAAWTAEDARRAVGLVHAELQRRVEVGAGEWPRLVLAIDELAQVDPGALDLLSGVLAVGRSKRVHVVAATQHPTVRLIGDKSNYAVRLVGQVTDGATAAIATGRRGTGAELLPGAGAFLCVDGAQLDRLQAYNVTHDAAVGLVGAIVGKWGEERVVRGVGGADAPVRTGAQGGAAAVEGAVEGGNEGVAPVRTGGEGVRFPLPRRAPTVGEAAEIRRLRAELGSLNQTIVAVYGSKSSDTHRWVSEALATGDVARGEGRGADAVAPILRMGVR